MKLTWSAQQTWSMPAAAIWSRNARAVAGSQSSRSGGGNMPTRGEVAFMTGTACGPGMSAGTLAR